RLVPDRRAVHQREVPRRAAVDVDDEVALGAPRDGGNLHAGAPERGQSLGEFEFAAGEGAREHLQLGGLERRLAFGQGATNSGGARGLGGAVGDTAQLLDGTRRGLDHHRFLELVLLFVVLDETQLVVAYRDDVAVLER